MNSGININVKSSYVPERSNPIQSYYLFTYTVYIENSSNTTTKLLSRYWSITDSLGMSEDIYGPGVVGKTPTIRSKTSFSYSSFCPLKTPMGFMKGSFRMVDEKGVEFDAEIGLFRLIASQVLN